MIFEILGVFVNTLTADDKSPFWDWENSPLPIQMQLFKKRTTFYQFFVHFLQYKSNFEHFEEKTDSPSSCISEIKDCQRFG